ncbi:MAG: hypothetical protein HC843_13350 [Sphingomonadales bacterium]|nr:hypothetical protein [Sphingomonadales bacterium]
MAIVTPLSDEQLRLLVNLRARYEAWMQPQQKLFELPYDLRIKTVDKKKYLYEIYDRGGNGRSLGRVKPQLQRQYDAYQQTKSELKARMETMRPVLAESAAMYRALRLPLLSSDAGPILRECDKRGLLGSHLYVVGTNAIAAYMAEAGSTVTLADETEDFDLAWVAREEQDAGAAVWHMLKAVDSTFTVNTERDFQARNAKAYEVELLVAPSRELTLPPNDRPRPVSLPEQEWLLLGRPVDQVIGCRDGSPARIVAPDPRYFALHKLWMAEQDKRNPLKRIKDRKQGLALLDLIRQAMPHFALDEEFSAALPAELGKFI